MNTCKVIGLDGSLANFGIAVAEVNTDTWEILSVSSLELSKTAKSKDKKVKRSDDDYMRFKMHWQKILATRASTGATIIVGEIPSGAQDARAAFAFGGVTAMLAGLDAFFIHGVSTITVTPSEVKQAATGTKHADKEDVISAMYGCFPDANWIVSSKPNGMNIKTPEGKYLTLANEHLADAVGIIKAGLEKCKKLSH